MLGALVGLRLESGLSVWEGINQPNPPILQIGRWGEKGRDRPEATETVSEHDGALNPGSFAGMRGFLGKPWPGWSGGGGRGWRGTTGLDL